LEVVMKKSLKKSVTTPVRPGVAGASLAEQVRLAKPLARMIAPTNPVKVAINEADELAASLSVIAAGLEQVAGADATGETWTVASMLRRLRADLASAHDAVSRAHDPIGSRPVNGGNCDYCGQPCQPCGEQMAGAR
jgi:hypothetical protein